MKKPGVDTSMIAPEDYLKTVTKKQIVDAEAKILEEAQGWTPP